VSFKKFRDMFFHPAPVISEWAVADALCSLLSAGAETRLASDFSTFEIRFEKGNRNETKDNSVC
jgi:hypothetical protein